MSWGVLLAVGMVSLGIACGKAGETGTEERTPAAASSAGGTVKPKPAPVVHRIDIEAVAPSRFSRSKRCSRVPA